MTLTPSFDSTKKLLNNLGCDLHSLTTKETEEEIKVTLEFTPKVSPIKWIHLSGVTLIETPKKTISDILIDLSRIVEGAQQPTSVGPEEELKYRVYSFRRVLPGEARERNRQIFIYNKERDSYIIEDLDNPVGAGIDFNAMMSTGDCVDNGVFEIYQIQCCVTGKIITLGEYYQYESFPSMTPQFSEIVKFIFGNTLQIVTKDLTVSNIKTLENIRVVKKKVEEEVYKIISFKREDDREYTLEEGSSSSYRFKTANGGYNLPTTSDVVSLPGVRITSIKRLSDGQIFKIGDRVAYTKSDEDYIYTIEGINHVAGINIVRRSGKGLLTEVENLRLIKPYGITQDKVLLYRDSRFYVITKDFSDTTIQGPFEGSEYGAERERWFVFFSTKEAAEEWLDKQVICITEDNKKIYNNQDRIFSVHKSTWLERQFTPRGAKNLNDFKHFSTSEAREEYIMYNKPLLSLKDIDNTISPWTREAIIKIIKENK